MLFFIKHVWRTFQTEYFIIFSRSEGVAQRSYPRVFGAFSMLFATRIKYTLLFTISTRFRPNRSSDLRTRSVVRITQLAGHPSRVWKWSRLDTHYIEYMTYNIMSYTGPRPNGERDANNRNGTPLGSDNNYSKLDRCLMQRLYYYTTMRLSTFRNLDPQSFFRALDTTRFGHKSWTI